MQSPNNTEIVQSAYAAFGRGDIQAILALLDDNVTWKGMYGAGPHVPTGGVRRGKAAVGEFFKQLAENVKFSQFEPREFIATGEKVVTLGHFTAATPKNKQFDADFAMVFTLRNGRVIGFQEFTDSAAVNAAYL